MIIFLCILAWLACGFLAVWLKYAIVDERRYDMPVLEAVVMSLFGVCLLAGAIIFVPLAISGREGGAILFKAKNE